MAAETHPAATHHLPGFIPGPDGSDVLMTVTAIILLLSVLGFGILYWRIHALPETIAHGRHKLQYEIVAVLGLISLFTHMHIFWIIGLLLAVIDLPDFGTPLNRIAGSAEKIAGVRPGEGTAADKQAAATELDHALPKTGAGDKEAGGNSSFQTPEIAPTKPKEPIHA